MGEVIREQPRYLPARMYAIATFSSTAGLYAVEKPQWLRRGSDTGIAATESEVVITNNRGEA